MTDKEKNQESTRTVLEEIRNFDIFSEIDYHKLIRECFPHPESSMYGIGLKELIEGCDNVYNGFMDQYDKIPDDEKPDKETFFNEVMEEGRKRGYEELIKVLEMIFAKNN
ncbi:MAG: hypothetical protein K6D97_01320 [Clostridia bacterium]|nr:hypothetical protein [Clostridia bacterium]